MAASSSAISVESFLLIHAVAIALFCSAYATNQRVVPVGSLFPSTNCKTTTGKGSLKVVSKFGPCVSNKNEVVNVTELLLRDKARVSSIHSKLSVKTDGSSGNLSTTYGINLGTGEYVVTIGLGTPEKELTLVFDTGSDLTWTQCLPCLVSCYKQQDAIFDPSLSSSYSNVSCSSSACSAVSENSSPLCSGPTCAYKVPYGDGSFTVGFIATETLTLTPTDIISNFLFGCGEDNEGFIGLTAGILGLGRGAVSIVEQTAPFYGQYFSYCLPPSNDSLGHLTFGQTNEPTLSFTPIVTIPPIPTLYGIGIVGISVGGQPLSLPSTLFSDAGAIIDSGTVITRLPPTAYVALRDSFQSGMTSYTTAPPISLFDTCYDFTGVSTISFPRIVFSLSGGVDLDLDFNGIFYVFDISQVCLAFAPNSADTDLVIYGNVQQRTFEIAYDVAGRRIGFGSSGC